MGSIFFVPTAELSPSSDMFQNGRHAPLVSIDLHCRPGKIVRDSGILRLNPYEVAVAVDHALKVTQARVVGPARSDHIVGTVPSKTKLGERPREIRPPVYESFQAGH